MPPPLPAARRRYSPPSPPLPAAARRTPSGWEGGKSPKTDGMGEGGALADLVRREGGWQPRAAAEDGGAVGATNGTNKATKSQTARTMPQRHKRHEQGHKVANNASVVPPGDDYGVCKWDPVNPFQSSNNVLGGHTAQP
eukprot:gene14351-biopygen566